MSTPDLLGLTQSCVCNAFAYDPSGDHLQTCQTKSAGSQVHDWVVYKFGALLGAVGRVKEKKKKTVFSNMSLGVTIRDSSPLSLH